MKGTLKAGVVLEGRQERRLLHLDLRRMRSLVDDLMTSGP